MSITTYDGLKVSVADWLNREDLTSVIPDFIELAENRIFHELRAPINEKTADLTLGSDGYATIPSDYLEVKDLFWNYNPISRVSLTQLHSYVDRTGVAPEVFAREQSKFRVFPIPTQVAGDTLRMIYYFTPENLSATASTNSIFQTAPELYLYGTLVEAANYLGSDGSRWEAGYQMAMGRALQHAKTSEYAGASSQVQLGY
jgi:hypothetical protein|tara:strand:+ start:3573 stop:4175 length:603 start_codon:yes stop_codon:yes gene_type:complete